MHNYIIMGVQGCGKGTQAKLLAEQLTIPHISIGDIFRRQAKLQTPLSRRVCHLMDSGQLLPDELVEEVVRARLAEPDCGEGFVLDGFPRNQAQAQFLLDHYELDAVILILVPDELVTRRIVARRVCLDCGSDYNVIHHPPRVPDKCDLCGGRVAPRPDDNETAVRHRIADYHDQTEPVLEGFRARGLIVGVDGFADTETVFHRMANKLRRRATERVMTRKLAAG
jgi:adenylate kinase